MKNNRVIAWWSGGVASALACILALKKYQNVHIAFCDTSSEHPDTYRFMKDWEKRTGATVHIYKSKKFKEPEEVWRHFNGLNFAPGAPCSSELKRAVRIKIQDINNDYGQVFGFDYCKKEIRRSKKMIKNYPEINPIFPLIEHKISRERIFRVLKWIGLKPPVIYKHFLNNNCIGADDSPKGGCVQGGIGYWQKMKTIYPKKFEYMANIEQELTEIKGEPVTICKDQRKGKRGIDFF